MQNIETAKLLKDIQAFVEERDWDKFHSVKNLAMALSVETSELVEIFQWMKEEDTNAVRHDPEKLARIRDELADIFFYLLRVASKTDTDLQDALLKKLEKNRMKYPADKVRGSSRKYDEY